MWQLLTFAGHILMLKAGTVLVVIPFLLELNGFREKRGTPQVVSRLSCNYEQVYPLRTGRVGSVGTKEIPP